MQFDFSVVDWSDDDSSPFDQCDYSSSGSSSSSTLLSSLSSKTPTVRFSQNDEIFLIPHVKEYSEEDIQAIWYRPYEFREMRSQAHRIVHAIEQQKQHQTIPAAPSESDSMTMRGLEFRTSEGSLKRSLHKREAYTAVMEEQERQWMTGQEDPDRIAAAYKIISTKCHGLALFRGIRDEHDVRTFTMNSNERSGGVKSLEKATSCCRRNAVLEDIKILNASTSLSNLLSPPSPAAA